MIQPERAYDYVHAGRSGHVWSVYGYKQGTLRTGKLGRNASSTLLAILGMILFIYLILGCFIDALALVLLTIPIFFPVVVDTLGYDPIWFGVVVVLVVAMGVITPPVGMNVYVIKGVAPEVPLETIFKGVWPFLVTIVICLILLMIFPGIATYLPQLLSGV